MFAYFEEMLLDTVHSERAQTVEAALHRACDRFGFTRDGRMNSVVVREAFHAVGGQGLTSRRARR
jgi:hypothetical protein